MRVAATACEDLAEIKELREKGKNTVREVMEELNGRGIKTQRRGDWHPQTVNVLLHRIEGAKPRDRKPVTTG